MSKWIRRTLAQVPANGTTTLAPAFPAPAAGNLLVCIAVGAGTTYTTPTGWALPTGGEAVGYTGLYVWTKTAVGTETSLSVTNSVANRPGGFVIYEFPAGSTFGTSASAATIHYSGPTGIPGRTGLTGTKLIMSALADAEPSAEAAIATDFTSASSDTLVEDTDVAVVFGTVPGYALAVCYVEDKTTPTYAVTFSSNAGSETKSALTFDITVASSAVAVNVGVDQSIVTGQVANLAATATGGSGTKTYAWTIVSGGTGTFGSASAASTTFTPSATGAFTLRCTVTDTSGSASDDVVVNVTSPNVVAAYASITSSTGWTATGGTVQAVLADALDSTYITSSDAPAGLLLDGVLQPMAGPGTGQDVTLTVRAQSLAASSASLVGRLYDGTALVATTASVPVTSTLGDVALTFPAAQVAAMPAATWLSGARLTISATAVA